MKPRRRLHDWDVTPKEAVAIQRSLAGLVVAEGSLCGVRLVAGADISWDKESGVGHAGVVVFTFPGLEEVERAQVSGQAPFPYVPGLLSFREGPLLLEAFALLRTTPDVVMFDGHGLAHPRAMGIATHLGILLDIRAIGCAKSLLTGTYREPGAHRGCKCALMAGDRRVGAVVRTRDSVRPVFVSVGHRVSLEEAVRFTLRCCDGYRIPRPTRVADHFVGELRRNG